MTPKGPNRKDTSIESLTYSRSEASDLDRDLGPSVYRSSRWTTKWHAGTSFATATTIGGVDSSYPGVVCVAVAGRN